MKKGEHTMAEYTGAHAKNKALILMRENPLESCTISANPRMGEFRLMLRFANISALVHATLPLSDLKTIVAMAEANRQTLQKRWAEAKDGDRGRKLKHEAIVFRRDVAHASANKPFAGLSDDQRAAAIATADAQYEAELLDAHNARRAAYDPAEPGLASHGGNFTTYMRSVVDRATAAAGISSDEEAELLCPSLEWHKEWDAFIARLPFVPLQLRLVRAFRARSAERQLLSTHTVHRDRAFARIGQVRDIFTPLALAESIDFANKMAAKCAPFTAQKADFEDLPSLAPVVQFDYQGDYFLEQIRCLSESEIRDLADDAIAAGYTEGDILLLAQFLDDRFPDCGVSASKNFYGNAALAVMELDHQVRQRMGEVADAPRG